MPCSLVRWLPAFRMNLLAPSMLMQTRKWCRYAPLLHPPLFIISGRDFQTISMIEFLSCAFVHSYCLQNELLDGSSNLGVANVNP